MVALLVPLLVLVLHVREWLVRDPLPLAPLVVVVRGAGRPVPVVHGRHHEAVAGQVVAEPAVSSPGAAKSVREDYERPLSLRFVQGFGPLEDGDVDAADEGAEEGGEAGLGQVRADGAQLLHAEVLGARGPARPAGQHRLRSETSQLRVRLHNVTKPRDIRHMSVWSLLIMG